jgi:acetyl-CoA carboxylase carboxyl transferase subunit alpha
MIGGLGKWSIFMIVGQQKDITRRRQYRNFGWQIQDIESAMKIAEKFGIPVPLIDTGCLSRAEAEERGQGEAIARNIFEMVRLKCLLLPLLLQVVH